MSAADALPATDAHGAVIRLKPLAVRTDAAEVEAFRAATGGAPAGVPLTFPMRWLTAPEIRSALQDLFLRDAEILVHEAQSFDYDAVLRIGDHYVLRVEAHRETAPARLVLGATIATPDDVVCGRVETVLRILVGDGDPRR